ncbi:lipopolysaccharide biosynthesis protein [Methyloceanibacter methanicus]|nr:polysaccharide biosynthesis C-terminal domain-containing protein [Methyloceanibacter methanicus]
MPRSVDPTSVSEDVMTGDGWTSSLQRSLGRLVSTSSLLSLARIAGAAAGLATQILLARTLTASGLGIFYSVTSLAAVMGVIAALGYPGIASRFVSRFREKGREDLLAAFIVHARKTVTRYAAAATIGVLAFAVFWPGLALEIRLATAAAALAIPANAALRLNGALAASFRQFALAYLPDTCIRPFVLLAGLMLLIAAGVAMTAALATCVLTVTFTGLAVVQYRQLTRTAPGADGSAASPPSRYLRVWRREAPPLVLVALFTFFFADVDILLVTLLLPSAETAIVGLCLKLALLVGFAVQVAHQVVVPDLADAHARKEHAAIHGVVLKAFGFPLAVMLGAIVVVALWGETILSLFGPEFSGAKLPLLILLGSQLARVLFGPSVALLSVVGAQRENAMLAVGALVVLALANVALVPAAGVIGAALAVVLAMIVWLGACAVVLARVSGLRTDVLHLAFRAPMESARPR